MNAEIADAVTMTEGAGVTVRRLFPVPGRRDLDPFLVFDEFFVPPGSGFPPHSHHGFEAITYLFAGMFRHEDNSGHKATLGPGGAQRFTAGSGLVHSEMPEGSEIAHGIQLWIDLSPSDKALDPAYEQIDADGIPEKRVGGAVVRTIVGAGSPLTIRTPMRYDHVTLSAGATFSIRLMPAWTRLLYVVDGAVDAGGSVVRGGEGLVSPPEDLRVAAGERSRLVIIAGRPHGSNR